MTRKHYVYRIDRISTGEWYIGKGSCAKYKDPADDGYMGSGKVLKDKMSVDPSDWVKSILFITSDEQEAYAVEDRLLGDRWMTDEQCLNMVAGGEYGYTKMSAMASISAENRRDEQSAIYKAKWQDPDYRAKMVAMSKANWQDPDYRAEQVRRNKERWANMSDEQKKAHAEAQSARMTERNKDPDFIAKRDAALKEGNARLWAERRDEMIQKMKDRPNKKLISPTGEEVRVRANEVVELLREGYTLGQKNVSLKLCGLRVYAQFRLSPANKEFVTDCLLTAKAELGEDVDYEKVGTKEFKRLLLTQ